MMIKLRDYQVAAIEQIRNLFLKGHKSILLQANTGAGKTAIAAEMIRLADSKGSSIWFICNRSELIEQTSRALDKINVEHSFIAAGRPYNGSATVFVCSIQTLFRRYTSLTPPKLIFWDEAHSIVAKTWSDVYNFARSSFHVLLTATPTRLSGEGFRDFATAIVTGPSVRDLINQGFLAEYRAFAPQEIDTSQFRTRMGEYKTDDVMSVVNEKKFIGSAIREYKTKFLGKKNIVFCVNVAHSQHIKDEFLAAGINCEHVDGTTPKEERDLIISNFKSGRTQVLTSVDLLTTGFDCPDIEIVTLLRPTKSTSLALQMMGRGLRPYPGKTDVVFLDHVNIFKLHGLPDEERQWTLDGMVKKPRANELSVKTCPMCFAALRVTIKQCPICEHTFASSREPIDLQSLGSDDELKELDKTKLKSRGKDIDKQRARSKDELLKLAIERGYKRPHFWVATILKARQQKKLFGK